MLTVEIPGIVMFFILMAFVLVPWFLLGRYLLKRVDRWIEDWIEERYK